MDSINQLKLEIEELEKELTRISSTQYMEKSYDVKEGGDITKKTDVGFDMIGSQGQIMNLQSRLQQKKEQLARLEQYAREGAFGKSTNTQNVGYHRDMGNPNTLKKEDDLRLNESLREQDFKRIKSIYKSNTSSFQRVMEFVSGKGPKWNNIKKYSQEELDALLKFYYKSADAVNQKEKNSKWRDFVTVLKNKKYLNEHISRKSETGHGR